ncbi:hypothetical protein CTT30_23435 (plasmid) [Vibrio coralliilyticus]|nr:hypothetical protein CTT30_23435 [Vibrio coralliilyticus]
MKTSRAERQYAEWVYSLPPTVQKVVKVGFLRFKAPRWWGDDRKVLTATRALKWVVCLAFLCTIFFAGMTLSINSKNKQWDLYTFNEFGEVEWISDLTKL